jgi:hypothetical protein
MSSQDLSGNRQAEISNAAIITVSLATLFVFLRFYTRWMKGVHFGVDDYALLLALVGKEADLL